MIKGHCQGPLPFAKIYSFQFLCAVNGWEMFSGMRIHIRSSFLVHVGRDTFVIQRDDLGYNAGVLLQGPKFKFCNLSASDRKVRETQCFFFFFSVGITVQVAFVLISQIQKNIAKEPGILSNTIIGSNKTLDSKCKALSTFPTEYIFVTLKIILFVNDPTYMESGVGSSQKLFQGSVMAYDMQEVRKDDHLGPSWPLNL